MKLGYLLTLFLTISTVKAQTTLTLLSAVDNQPLANVLVYYKTNLIGETNKEGKASLQLTNIDSLVFVKNDYEDIVLAKNQLTPTILMVKNRVILLNEVVVSPMTAEKLLKKVGDFIEEAKTKKGRLSYKIPHHLQIYNKFMAGNDTLHYLNNRFTFERGNFKINDQTKIVKNFRHVQVKENISKVYSWGGKEADFWDLFSLTPLGIHYSADFNNFFLHQDLFDYKIVASETYYRLEFKQKKKYFLFSIEGYLIVDKQDFGIYEFETRLLNNKPRFISQNTNLSNSKPAAFKIDAETYRFKYTKESDGYILDHSSKNTIFTAEKGQHKNIRFIATTQVERTVDFGDRNLKGFDAFKWDIK